MKFLIIRFDGYKVLNLNLMFIALAIIAFSLLIPSALAHEIHGRVVSVTDGDTIKVLSAKNTQTTIRLDGVDAPEKSQPFGGASKKALAKKIADRDVLVLSKEKDRYGRTIGVVMLDGRNINREMVAEGYAWAYLKYLTDQRLIELESEAKASKRGLWALQPDQVQAPWEWRSARRSGQAISNTNNAPIDGQCGQVRTCSEMTSCHEARFYLSKCGFPIDGDGDGVPCESICR
jgi:endonuclease YncB( thermonuclease family)